MELSKTARKKVRGLLCLLHLRILVRKIVLMPTMNESLRAALINAWCGDSSPPDLLPPISENVTVDMRANKNFSDLMTAVDRHALRLNSLAAGQTAKQIDRQHVTLP
jgi:hypothetical protein